MDEVKTAACSQELSRNELWSVLAYSYSDIFPQILNLTSAALAILISSADCERGTAHSTQQGSNNAIFNFCATRFLFWSGSHLVLVSQGIPVLGRFYNEVVIREVRVQNCL